MKKCYRFHFITTKYYKLINWYDAHYSTNHEQRIAIVIIANFLIDLLFINKPLIKKVLSKLLEAKLDVKNFCCKKLHLRKLLLV